MGEYWTNDITVYDFDKCIDALKQRNDDQISRIKYLEAENKKLKDKSYKDNELKKMKDSLEQMKKDYWRGFPISEDEEKSINKWKENHETEIHGVTTLNQKLKRGGCIGGNYSYHFIPTSIGVSGKIKCSCGAEFEFCEIG